MKTGLWHAVMMVWMCCTATVYGTVVEVEGRAPADESMTRSRALADALRVDIPGMLKSDFEIEIGRPLGSDVVQVIACTNENALHKEIRDLATTTTKDDPYPVMPRGMNVKKAKTASKANLSARTKWGERHIVVSTFPKDK